MRKITFIHPFHFIKNHFELILDVIHHFHHFFFGLFIEMFGYIQLSNCSWKTTCSSWNTSFPPGSIISFSRSIPEIDLVVRFTIVGPKDNIDLILQVTKSLVNLIPKLNFLLFSDIKTKTNLVKIWAKISILLTQVQKWGHFNQKIVLLFKVKPGILFYEVSRWFVHVS